MAGERYFCIVNPVVTEPNRAPPKSIRMCALSSLCTATVSPSISRSGIAVPTSAVTRRQLPKTPHRLVRL